MARKMEQFGDIFANSKKEEFKAAAVTAENELGIIPNPYIGNKRKMLADIALHLYDVIDSRQINNICDLFAGSSVVSALFKMLGKKVSNNDILVSSYINAVALLSNSGYDYIIPKDEWQFLINNVSKDKSSFIETKYIDTRFTQKEAFFIDNFNANCKTLFGNIVTQDGYRAIKNETTFIKACIAHTSLIHFIMLHCFVGGRLNNGQIIASLNHRLEHQRNQNTEMSFHKMKQFSFNCKGEKALCSRNDVFDFLNINNEKYDLIYIDPPYGGQQSDYAFMYQFFEEYLLQTNIEDIQYLQDKSKRFSKTKTYQENFEDLLKKIPSEPVLAISYNNNSWADIKIISDTVSKHRSKIEIKEIEYSYKYRSAENSSGLEYLIIAW